MNLNNEIPVPVPLKRTDASVSSNSSILGQVFVPGHKHRTLALCSFVADT